MKQFCIYILTNKNNKVLYIGVTGNLKRRLIEHKNKTFKGFTEKYNCNKLVYFEQTENIMSALEREKQLKRWHREWKNNLISDSNPNWKDLFDDII